MTTVAGVLSAGIHSHHVAGSAIYIEEHQALSSSCYLLMFQVVSWVFTRHNGYFQICAPQSCIDVGFRSPPCQQTFIAESPCMEMEFVNLNLLSSLSRPHVALAFLCFRATHGNWKTQAHTGRLFVDYAAFPINSARFDANVFTSTVTGY